MKSNVQQLVLLGIVSCFLASCGGGGVPVVKESVVPELRSTSNAATITMPTPIILTLDPAKIADAGDTVRYVEFYRKNTALPPDAAVEYISTDNSAPYALTVLEYGEKNTTYQYYAKITGTTQNYTSTILTYEINVNFTYNTLEEQLLVELNKARTTPQTCTKKDGNGTVIESRSFPAAAPVTLNPRLTGAARKHSQDMADKNYFEHTSQNGTMFMERIQAERYNYQTVGENIARTSGNQNNVTLTTLMDSWLASFGHCTILMNGNFKNVGIGIAYDATVNKTYWTTDFGVLKSASL